MTGLDLGGVHWQACVIDTKDGRVREDVRRRTNQATLERDLSGAPALLVTLETGTYFPCRLNSHADCAKQRIDTTGSSLTSVDGKVVFPSRARYFSLRPDGKRSVRMALASGSVKRSSRRKRHVSLLRGAKSRSMNLLSRQALASRNSSVIRSVLPP